MALSDHQLLHAYRLLLKVFPEDLHISRPLIQMMQQHGYRNDARNIALTSARRMLAIGKPSHAIGFLALCQQLEHPDHAQIAALRHMAQINMGAEIESAGSGRQFELIEQLSDLEARDFISKASVKPMQAGNDIVRQGESSQSFYLILGGEVEIRLIHEDGYKVMNMLRAGDFFGEFACIYQLRRSATVTSISDCMLLEFSEHAVHDLVDNYPIAGDYLIRTVQRRMVHAMTYAIPAFSELPEADRRWVAEESHVFEYQKGEAIPFLSGSCNILLTGKAQLESQEARPTLQAGTLFGLKNKSGALTALERSLVCQVPENIVNSFMNLYSTFGHQARKNPLAT